MADRGATVWRRCGTDKNVRFRDALEAGRQISDSSPGRGTEPESGIFHGRIGPRTAIHIAVPWCNPAGCRAWRDPEREPDILGGREA